jgi:hypothetical protein
LGFDPESDSLAVCGVEHGEPWVRQAPRTG